MEDEDAVVTTVDDAYDYVNDHSSDETLGGGVWNLASGILTAYGWYFIALAVVIACYWETIRQKLDQRYNERSEREYDAKCKKDPDWLKKRQEEMEAARRRMQEDLNAKAALHAAKLKEKEEKRRAELLAAEGAEGGRRLGDGNSTSPTTSNATKSTSATKKAYRPEYNPLMGSGSSGGYRPPRRGCSGGGCG